MKKAFAGALPGLFIGGAVMLYFSWVNGIISFRLVPPGIESFEFTPQAALVLFQCLLTGAIAGSVTYVTGHCGPGVIAAVVVGYGLGFFYVRQDVPPWGDDRCAGNAAASGVRGGVVQPGSGCAEDAEQSFC